MLILNCPQTYALAYKSIDNTSKIFYMHQACIDLCMCVNNWFLMVAIDFRLYFFYSYACNAYKQQRGLKTSYGKKRGFFLFMMICVLFVCLVGVCVYVYINNEQNHNKINTQQHHIKGKPFTHWLHTHGKIIKISNQKNI